MRPLTRIAVPVLVMVLAAACGSSGDDEAGTATTETTATTAVPSSAEASTSVPSTAAPTTLAPTTTEAGPTLELTIDGLEPLGDGFAYEAWLIVDDQPVSAGVFDDPAGATVPVAEGEASAVVVTIEPVPDPDPAPADTHVLAGDLVDGAATLTVGHEAAIGTDFAEASGRYILATPTDGTGTDENERSGIWWTEVPRAQSLFVPALPAGWAYESWVVIDGVPVTGGTFLDPFAADDAAPFSGPQEGPPLVGEDYLVNAPDGLTFPRDLRGMTAVISVEPVPDDSPAPFAIKPLVGAIPGDAVDHTAYPQDNVAADLPTGTATLR
ncbi:MAG: anti-sigma factor [Acidimicrobiales bacterium]